MPKLVQNVQTETLGTFPELLAKARKGDRIVLYEGPYSEWESHPDGVIVATDDPNSNDTLLLFYGPRREPIDICRGYYFTDWHAHPKGAVVKRNGKLLLVDRTKSSPRIMAEDVLRAWKVNWADGSVIVQRGNDLLRCNGSGSGQVFFESPRGKSLDDWDIGFDGTLVVRHGRQFLLSGTKEVYKRSRWSPKTEIIWYAAHEGAFLLYTYEIEYCAPNCDPKVLYKDLWEDSVLLPHGRLALSEGGRVLICDLDGGIEEIYSSSDEITCIDSHPNGIMIRSYEKLFLLVLNPPVHETHAEAVPAGGMIEP